MPLIMPNFVPFWKPLCDISAAKYRRFLWRRDPHKTVNDIVSALPCGDNNETWFSHRELFCLGTFLLHPAGLYQTQMTVTEATYFIRAYIHKSIIYCQNKKTHYWHSRLQSSLFAIVPYIVTRFHYCVGCCTFLWLGLWPLWQWSERPGIKQTDAI